MYTINRSMNGGWYGEVTADTPTEALDAARELADILATLRSEHPKPAKEPGATAESEKPEGLNDAGLACLAFCEANPRCTHDEYTKAGHTLRTVKWLKAHGYLKSVAGTWFVDRRGLLEP